MRQILAVLSLLTMPSLVFPAESFRLSLKSAMNGELPSGWIAAKTGEGPGSTWKVVEDETAPGGKTVAQVSDQGPKPLFNLCIAKETSFKDLEFTVSLKAITGKIDQGGGPVWRYVDAKNYYVARVNPLEDNYRVYKVVNGKRIQLGSADVKASSGQWHTLRVVHKGNHIQCYLNGKLHLDVEDGTLPDAGRVGLWTKADAQTRFVDFEVKELR